MCPFSSPNYPELPDQSPHLRRFRPLVAAMAVRRHMIPAEEARAVLTGYRQEVQLTTRGQAALRTQARKLGHLGCTNNAGQSQNERSIGAKSGWD